MTKEVCFLYSGEFTKSDTIYVFQPDEFFFAYDSLNLTVAKTLTGKRGFLYNTYNFIYLKDLNNKEKKEIVNRILDQLIFFKIENNNDIKEYKYFIHFKYFICLDIIENLVCNEDDIEVLEKFLDSLVAIKNSSWEPPMITLTNLYRCKSQYLKRAINLNKDSKYISEVLQYGLENY